MKKEDRAAYREWINRYSINTEKVRINTQIGSRIRRDHENKEQIKNNNKRQHEQK